MTKIHYTNTWNCQTIKNKRNLVVLMKKIKYLIFKKIKHWRAQRNIFCSCKGTIQENIELSQGVWQTSSVASVIWDYPKWLGKWMLLMRLVPYCSLKGWPWLLGRCLSSLLSLWATRGDPAGIVTIWTRETWTLYSFQTAKTGDFLDLPEKYQRFLNEFSISFINRWIIFLFTF